ncbi:MAG: histidine phosphatase family protein [Acidimicrobiia bacterium]|nr:histidine phosphatase family protein [Actinomycetota bacterium]MBL6924330.1 histidine phosphatase family protein [Acidimicrobiia bacterium]MBL6926771.1 histidine phosphatase family protein [Acidimicrobiia bacterium]
MELLIIRHALPVRVDNRHTGEEADPTLSDLGRRQADALAHWLAVHPAGTTDGVHNEKIDAVYSGPKRRARETAAPLAGHLGLEVSVEPDLDEFDFGEPEYIPIEELKASGDPRWLEFMSEDSIPEPEAFQARVVAAMERIISDNPGRRVAVSCHGGVIGAYLSHLLGIDRIFFFEASYTSVSRVMAASTGERSVGSMNELAHLRLAGVALY